MKLRALAHAIAPDLILLAVFVLVLLIIWAGLGAPPLTFGHGSTALPPAVIGALVLTPLSTRFRGAWRNPVKRVEFLTHAITVVRDWSPLVFVMVIYDNFHDMTFLVRPNTVDAALRAFDERLFSVEPTLWLQRITVPWLTEYLS